MSDSDTAALTTDEQRVLKEVSEMIVAVLGEPFVAGSGISMNTRIVADLDMASLDMVELSVQLRDHYGERVNPAQFIADLSLDDALALKVGHLVRYITHCTVGS
ncbi:MAG: acyl carrier protein [Pseudonocardiaceae bacterium]